MKSTNLPSMQTAQAYGCQRVDEFVDAEKEKTTVFALSKKHGLKSIKWGRKKGRLFISIFHVMDKEKELTGSAGSIVYALDVVNEYLHRQSFART